MDIFSIFIESLVCDGADGGGGGGGCLWWWWFVVVCGVWW